eukprot:TRINITY_DN2904_c1_g6_i1.p1 TRINITY_DN2904_c1_g6~~TRINITY_DN2904_c1_g6_i1.p1  ORF type:complete len:1006 (+),score=178.34 TRINITY_DN2904_c1_g6_i1:153-3170(+)
MERPPSFGAAEHDSFYDAFLFGDEAPQGVPTPDLSPGGSSEQPVAQGAPSFAADHAGAVPACLPPSDLAVEGQAQGGIAADARSSDSAEIRADPSLPPQVPADPAPAADDVSSNASSVVEAQKAALTTAETLVIAGPDGAPADTASESPSNGADPLSRHVDDAIQGLPSDASVALEAQVQMAPAELGVVPSSFAEVQADEAPSVADDVVGAGHGVPSNDAEAGAALFAPPEEGNASPLAGPAVPPGPVVQAPVPVTDDACSSLIRPSSSEPPASEGVGDGAAGDASSPHPPGGQLAPGAAPEAAASSQAPQAESSSDTAHASWQDMGSWPVRPLTAAVEPGTPMTDTSETPRGETPAWVRQAYPPSRVKSSEVLEVLWGEAGSVPDTPSSAFSAAKRQHSSVLSLAEAAAQHAECAICFDALCDGQVVVFLDQQRRRVCRHYFHEPCVAEIRPDSQGLFRCPLCRAPFGIMMRFPDPRVEPKQWFLLSSTNEEDARLAKTEVVDVLCATVNTDAEMLERVVETKWKEWDSAGTGYIEWEHAEGLLEFVRMNVPGRRQKPPPDLRADRGSWFEFFDVKGSGILTEGQVARGVVKTYAVPAGEEQQAVPVEDTVVLAVAKIIREVFEVFATRSPDMLSPVLRGEGWGAASISKGDFVKQDGLADAIIAALEHEGVAATARGGTLHEDELLAATLHREINDRAVERGKDIVRALPWECPACTFINAYGDSHCVMCEAPAPAEPFATEGAYDICAATPLPPSPSDSPTDPPPGFTREGSGGSVTPAVPAAAPLPGGGWACPLCTFVNGPAAPACSMCETPRSSGAPPGYPGAPPPAASGNAVRQAGRTGAPLAHVAPPGYPGAPAHLRRGIVQPGLVQGAQPLPMARAASGLPSGGAAPARALPARARAQSAHASTAYFVPAASVLPYPAEARWEPDTAAAECRRCGTSFGFFTRRHHCRGCGRLFCNACAPTRPSFRVQDREERLCEGCFATVTDAILTPAQQRPPSV